MSKKVLVTVGLVVTHPFHGSPGSILRVRELSKSLSNMGVNVHIYSYYTSTENWGDKVTFHKLKSLTSTLGLTDISYKITRRALNNHYFINHIMSKKMLDNSINSLANNLVDSVKEDLDLIQGEQEIAAAACVRARKELGIPVVTSLHNIWVEELIAMNLIDKSSEQYTFLQKLEREIVTEANLVVAVSEGMAAYLKERYSFNHSNIAVIPPGGHVKINQVHNRIAPFKVVYAGLVVQRAQIDLFIRSMPFILKKYPDTKFYVTRRGEELSKIKRLAKQLGVNPEFYWFENSVEFYDFLASCHVGVVTSSDDLPRKIGPAVKLFDYLSVGLPVVANDIGGWTNIIKSEQVGLLTKCDPKSFAKGILELLDNPELSRKYGDMGLKLVKSKLSWDNSAKILFERYRLLVDMTSVSNTATSCEY